MLFFFVAGIGLLGIVHAVPCYACERAWEAMHKIFRKALIALLRNTVFCVTFYHYSPL